MPVGVCGCPGERPALTGEAARNVRLRLLVPGLYPVLAAVPLWDMRTLPKHCVRLLVAIFTMAALLALTPVTPAHATEQCLGTTSNGDGPDTDSGDCVYLRVYTAVDGRIIVAYSGNQDYDFYQLRWSRPGRAETQSRVRGEGAAGSWWALNNAWSNTPYTFKVQACYSSLFGSDCTPWQEQTHVKRGR